MYLLNQPFQDPTFSISVTGVWICYVIPAVQSIINCYGTPNNLCCILVNEKREDSKNPHNPVNVVYEWPKDMTGREDRFRAPAIRSLCAIITDPYMLQSIERYMKQAIVGMFQFIFNRKNCVYWARERSTLGLTPRKLKNRYCIKPLLMSYIKPNFMGNTNLDSFLKNFCIYFAKSRF